METKPLYLNGRWVGPEAAIEVVNPSTGEVIGSVATASRRHVAEALADAERAWAAWRGMTGSERGVYLDHIADVLKRRSEEIARTITLENGKPLAQSRGEVAMSIDHLRWFAGEARPGLRPRCAEPSPRQEAHGAPRAHRRRRRDLSVEFSACAGGAEDRSGIGGGLSGDT